LLRGNPLKRIPASLRDAVMRAGVALRRLVQVLLAVLR